MSYFIYWKRKTVTIEASLTSFEMSCLDLVFLQHPLLDCSHKQPLRSDLLFILQVQIRFAFDGITAVISEELGVGVQVDIRQLSEVLGCVTCERNEGQIPSFPQSSNIVSTASHLFIFWHRYTSGRGEYEWAVSSIHIISDTHARHVHGIPSSMNVSTSNSS